MCSREGRYTGEIRFLFHMYEFFLDFWTIYIPKRLLNGRVSWPR